VLKTKNFILILTFICIITTAIGVYLLGGIKPEVLQSWLESLGIWSPIIYILLYTFGTILILPSTPLNLCGGALFGVWWGTFWTAIAAMIAAIIAFAFTRTVGRDYIAKKFVGQWEALDAELHQGGLFYMFAIRLLPIVPYGIVNFAAGLSSIRFRDYLIGTALGTVPGILPFVMMGSGLQALGQGDMMPLMIAFTLAGMLVGVATWYRRRRQFPKKKLK
jgi:uncharacterized membrane protein YdjX (TVP38/TMEM64 family)